MPGSGCPGQAVRAAGSGKNRDYRDGGDEAEQGAVSQRPGFERELDTMSARWNNHGLKNPIPGFDPDRITVDACLPARVVLFHQDEPSAAIGVDQEFPLLGCPSQPLNRFARGLQFPAVRQFRILELKHLPE